MSPYQGHIWPEVPAKSDVSPSASGQHGEWTGVTSHTGVRQLSLAVPALWTFRTSRSDHALAPEVGWGCHLCEPLKEPHQSDNTAINCQVCWTQLFCILQDVNLGTQLAHSPLTVCSFNMGLYLALEICVCSRKQWQYLLGTTKTFRRKQERQKTKEKQNTLKGEGKYPDHKSLGSGRQNSPNPEFLGKPNWGD